MGTFSRVMTRSRTVRALRAAIILMILAAAPAAAVLDAATQPPTTAAQDGFLPVDESKVQEKLPAAPLVMIAYAVAWTAIFVYVWTLWSRLAKVEREILEVSRRIEAGSRR